MHRDLIEQYARGAEKLSQSIRSLTREDLLALPDADANVGKWSIQQVIVHLADCDLVFADRIKRVIAEDNPPLLAFDENLWAAALQYDDQSAEDSVALIELARKQIATILLKLPDGAFQRYGTHSHNGKITLTEILGKAVHHFDHHLKFIHAKREKMGKEMW